MGYVFDFHDARWIEKRIEDPAYRRIRELQVRMALDMLEPLGGESLLEIGSGAGSCLEAFAGRGIKVSGIDPSPYMLDLAGSRLGTRADLHRGIAEDLPFEDNSFHHACLINTLEFVDDPEKAIEEACRVAKNRVFLAVMNKYARKARLRAALSERAYTRARFFSPWELRRIIRRLAGPVPVTWKTACHLPGTAARFAPRLDGSGIECYPFGGLIGLVIVLVPRYRTTPIPLTLPSERPGMA